jgi:glycogen synthase
MRIAFVSHEYPPDTAFGGIATYVRQAATLLAGRGHSVEVFAAGPKIGAVWANTLPERQSKAAKRVTVSCRSWPQDNPGWVRSRA